MSIDLYPDIVLSEDQSPNCGPEIDILCDEIHKACKGFGTNEEKLIWAMAKDPTTRTLVSHHYEKTHGKNLRKLVDKECSGDFGRVMELLAVPPDVADVQLIRKATKGAGTNEWLLYTIVCGRSNADIAALKKAYFKQYEKDLGSLLKSELTGDLEDFAIASVQGIEEKFDPDVHTAEKAKDDAEAFYDAGQGRWGTDEKSFFRLLCISPPEHLKEVNKVYTEKHDVTLFKVFEKELRGDVEDAVVFTLGMKLRPYETVAKLIKKACDGIGTDELLLSACLVRYQPILPLVMDAYNELFGESLADRVRGETKHDYREALISIIAQSNMKKLKISYN